MNEKAPRKGSFFHPYSVLFFRLGFLLHYGPCTGRKAAVGKMIRETVAAASVILTFDVYTGAGMRIGTCFAVFHCSVLLRWSVFWLIIVFSSR